MARVARVFAGFSQAEEANRAHYTALSPDERLALVLELARRHREDEGEAADRLARVYRVVELADAEKTDTRPDMNALHVALMRAAGPVRRFAMARSLTQTVMDLSKRALRRRHPDATQVELDRAFAVLHYGEAVARLLDE